jgi:hypothetical protein
MFSRRRPGIFPEVTERVGIDNYPVPHIQRTEHFARLRPSPLPTGRMSNGRLWPLAASSSNPYARQCDVSHI